MLPLPLVVIPSHRDLLCTKPCTSLSRETTPTEKDVRQTTKCLYPGSNKEKISGKDTHEKKIEVLPRTILSDTLLPRSCKSRFERTGRRRSREGSGWLHPAFPTLPLFLSVVQVMCSCRRRKSRSLASAQGAICETREEQR